MKTKKLANVLIKILGLSTVVYAIPGIFTGLFTIFQHIQVSGSWIWPISNVVSLVVGICLVIKSRDVAEYLFKEDDE